MSAARVAWLVVALVAVARPAVAAPDATPPAIPPATPPATPPAIPPAIPPATPPATPLATPPAIPTAIVGGSDAGFDELRQRIALDDRFVVTDDLSRARLIWQLGPDPAGRGALDARVRAGAALVVVGAARGFDRRATRFVDARATVRVVEGRTGPIASQVIWPTAPQVGRRADADAANGWQVWVETTDGAPVVLTRKQGRGRVAWIAAELGHPSNRDLLLWPYFNYFVYALNCELTGAAADNFATWPRAPLPGGSALWVLAIVLGGAWLGTLLMFFRARSYARRHPEVLDEFFAGAAQAPAAGAGKSAWARIGFTRPLAGFLTLAASMFLLFAPYYWLTNIVIPNDVQPFPQAKGIWDFAWEALQVAWYLFDAGTFVAFVKYFAEYRVKDPRESLKSAQFFVWWQILTGLVQVTMACVAAVVILPNTRYGYGSSFIILVALGQYPGFFGVITLFFQAYQRFDYNVGLDLLSDWVLRFVLQIPLVLAFRAWGAANPEYGEAMGAAVGIGVAYHVSTLITFFIGVGLYRRLGLRLLPLFLVHFDLATAKRMLWYGVRVVLGTFFFRVAKTAEKVVISLYLLNYTEWLGIESQIHYNLMFLLPLAYRFFETAMAAVSESHGNDKPALTQYYVARFIQVGHLYTAIGLSVLLALGTTFIEQAMDPQWARAADYLGIAACIGAFFATAWMSDMLQKGAGKPELYAVVLGAEQALRLGLFYLMIPAFQFYGFYAAILVAIAFKVGLAWTINHRVIVRVRLYAWQMFVAPALAGLLNFAVWRGAAAVLEPQGRGATTALFFTAALMSFFICFFACGLLGGYDRAFAEELDGASRMTGPLRPITRLFYRAARAGWRLSPLHDRFAMTVVDDAAREADELEATRARAYGSSSD